MDYQTADMRLSEWLAKERYSPMPADIRRIGKDIAAVIRREPKTNSKGEITEELEFESPLVQKYVKAEWMRAARQRLERAKRLKAAADDYEAVEWHRGHPDRPGEYLIKYLEPAVRPGEKKPEVDDPALKVKVSKWVVTKDWKYWEGVFGMAYYWAEID